MIKNLRLIAGKLMERYSFFVGGSKSSRVRIESDRASCDDLR